MRWHLVLAAALALGPRAPAGAGQGGAAPPRDPGPDASRPELVLETGGFTTAVTDLDFSPDGRILAAASEDKTVRIWDLGTGQLRTTLRGQRGIGALGACNAVAFSPDGRALVVGVQDYSPDGALRVYDTADLSRLSELLPAHPQGGVVDVAFSPDGRWLATVGIDGKLDFWDWRTRTLRFEVAVKLPLTYLGFPVTGLPIAIATDARGLHVWSVIQGKSIEELAPQELQGLLESSDDLQALQTTLVRVNKAIEGFGKIQTPYPEGAQQIKLFLDTGHCLALGTGKQGVRNRYWVGLWSATRGAGPVQVYERHAYVPTALGMDSSGNLVASGDILGQVHIWEAETGKTRFRFTGSGRPIYRVAYDASGKHLAFGSTPLPAGRWGYNSYAEPEQVFDLERRRIVDGAAGTHRTEVTHRGARELKVRLDRAKQMFSIRCDRGGQLESQALFPLGMPMCFSLLESTGPGFPDPVVVGVGSGVSCYDPRTMITRREFVGHSGLVTSLSESPDGRFLATSSTDRTLRIWSLQDFRDLGMPDFDTDASLTVIRVVPGGSAARAGIQVGDRWIRMDGLDRATLMDQYLKRRWDFRSGQLATLEMERGNQSYRAQVTLAPGSDWEEPLLSLFITADGEWVMWTPQGYYDASLGGDRLIGWHINQGPARAAKFYLAQQFRKRFYRPDVIDRVLQTGDVSRAVALADQQRVRVPEAMDLRRPEDISRMEPPRVRLLEPAEGARVETNQVTVRAEVLSQNELPIGDVTILVNGRPAQGKDMSPAPDDPRRRTVVSQVELEPGSNRVAVVAANEASSSQPASVTVRYEAPKVARVRPSLYILAVGVSDYERKELALQFAHRDAADFAAIWAPQEGAVYETVEARVLTDREATASNIRDGMDWLVRSATQHDLAIIFFSAHGTYDARRNYYLATYEIDPDRLRSTAIPYSDVARLIQDLPCKVLLFADTCHSGGITGAKGLGDDPLRELVSEAVGTVVFASSTPREVSFEDPRWGHGAFTKALLDCMSDPASDLDHDGYLGLTELDYHLARRVKELTDGQQHPVTEKPPTISDFNFYQFVRAGN